MEQLFSEYETRLERRRRKPATVRSYRAAIARFEAGLADFGATATTVEPWQVEDFFANLDLAWTTRSQTLTYVRAAYVYAMRRGRVSADPTYDVDLGRRPDSDPVVIPTAELREIKAACRNSDDDLLFHLFAYTGMRRFEVAKLGWEDVNLNTGMMRVVGKADKLRRVPIHPALGERLAARRYHLGQPIVRWVHLDHLAYIAPGRGFHDFRRTAATSLRRNGAQPPVIDRIFGWAPRGIRERYYDHVAEEEMSAAILRLYADDPL